MDEISRYAVGLDVGTENVRAVVASVAKDGRLSIVGYGEARNAGMRKGVVANLAGPGESIDRMLGEVERMSGHEVNSATVSVNGSHILATRTEGMIAVGAMEHEINEEDLKRVEEVSVVGRIPANRDVLDLIPLSYALDGQGGVKDPIGMTGSRLEMQATIVSALSPNCDNLRKAVESANVHAERLVPSAVAAGRAVLNERQMENGVAVVDMGAATTSIAIFEEGDLQYVGVVPAGSNNVTNDLAIMLGIDTEVAEELKCRFVTGALGEKEKPVVIKINGAEHEFSRKKIDDVVQARLTEIFEHIQKEIKHARYDKRLPEGIVLVGGGAKMRDIDVFVRSALQCSVKIGIPNGLGGVSDSVEKPEYATAVGLMLMSVDSGQQSSSMRKSKKNKPSKGFLKKLFSKF